jgi:predicted RNase H-like nuclease (RuvC/YqgF family)
MAQSNGDYDWRERLERIEDSIERNWADHERMNRNAERMDRNIGRLHTDLVKQKENVDNLLLALRELIDRIPPENLK